MLKEAVDKMPTELRYTSPAGHTVIMEHAGYTPFGMPRRSHDPLWDRDHFYDSWDEGFYPNKVLQISYHYLCMIPLVQD